MVACTYTVNVLCVCTVCNTNTSTCTLAPQAPGPARWGAMGASRISASFPVPSPGCTVPSSGGERRPGRIRPYPCLPSNSAAERRTH